MPEPTEREKIILIAERVMGWTIEISSRGNVYAAPPGSGDEQYDYCLFDADGAIAADGIWNPCTFISHAVQVVEKRIAFGYTVEIESGPGRLWCVRMGGDWVRNESLAAAICDAILATLGDM